MPYSFSDLIDIKRLQELMDKFHLATGIPVGIVGAAGEILVATGWQEICTRFHRVDPATRIKCMQSDEFIKGRLSSGCVEYKCMNGMWDIAVPILIAGEHLATLFLGQYFYDDEKIDVEFFKKQAAEFGFDETAYLNALSKVPVFSREKVRRIIDYYSDLVDMISGMGLSRLKLSEAESALRIGEEKFRTILENSFEHIIITDKNGVVKFASNRIGMLLGYCSHELIGDNFFKFVHPQDRPSVIEAFLRAQEKNRGVFTREFRIQAFDGSFYFVESDGQNFLDEKAVDGFVIVFHDITARKRAEASLIESEDRFSMAFVASNDGLWDWNIPENKVYLSPSYFRMLGYEPDEIAVSVQSWEKMVHPDFWEKVRALIKDNIENKSESFAAEFKIITKSGEYIWVLNKGKVVARDASGGATRMVGVQIDITSRKKAEAELGKLQKGLEEIVVSRTAELATLNTLLLDEQKRQRALLDGIPDIAWMKDADSRFIAVNQPFGMACGLDPKDVVGKTDLDIWPEEVAVKYRKDDFDVIESKKMKRVEEPLVIRGGRQVWIETIKVPITNYSGDVIGTVGIARDITERRRAEEILKNSREKLETEVRERTNELTRANEFLKSEIVEREKAESALQRSNARLKAVFNNAAVGISILAPDGRYILFNSRWAEMLGYTPEELYDANYNEYVHPDDLENSIRHFSALISNVISGYRMEKRYVRKDGSVFTGDLSVTPIVGKEGRPDSIIAIVSDITSRKEIEEEIKKARDSAERANRAKSDFLANISHEIRTPMNAIVGMTELIGSTDLENEQKEYVSVIRQSSESLMVLINDILDVSKIESGKFELEQVDFDLRELLDSVHGIFLFQTKQKKLGFTVDISPEIPKLLSGDPVRLRQVVVNFVGNAVKFTRKGSIAVSVGVSEIYAGKREDHDTLELQFSVRDTGIGIPLDVQGRIFEGFIQSDSSTTRKYGGTGLGLTINRMLVKRMGGRIWLESSPGKGSVFHFTARLKRSLSKPSDSAGPGPEPFHRYSLDRTLSILLVEDNAVNRRITVKMIERENHKVEIAGNGAEALKLLKKRKFDLVLMDIQMPVMDGYEATRRIRAGGAAGIDPDIKIFAMTAHTMKGDREKCIAAGMDDYIPKPFKSSDLFRVITKHLGRAQMTPDNQMSGSAPAKHAKANDRRAQKPPGTQKPVGAPEKKNGKKAAPARKKASGKTHAAPKVVDIAAALASVDGEEKIYRDVAKLFLKIAPGQLSELKKLARGDDPARAARAAHTMKSSVGSVGAFGLMKAAMAMEQVAERGDRKTLASMLKNFEKDFSRAVEEIKEYLKRVKA